MKPSARRQTEITQIPMVPGANVDAYLTAISSLPALTAEAEKALAESLACENNVAAARQLVMSQLRMVAYVAKGYLGYGLPLGDLIQEGNVGLMKAVKRFNPGAGVRLMTFALYWVKAEIHEYILRNHRMVRTSTTKAQRKLFFNLRRQSRSRNWLTVDELEHIAQTLNVSVRDVREMEYRMAGNDTSFDPLADDDDESAMLAPAQQLGDHRYDPAHQYEQSVGSTDLVKGLQDALGSLDARSRQIVEQRYLREKKATLQDLAGQFKVSAERIRQLESLALAKLKVALPVAA
ncbi:RNA polymerase sigma factor RpoH [Pseudomonas guariconensis]|uniref:RNA polymerase sigma factor RpoH n=1 Tax=Pseudomonas guariconensis TaxID=1288410 RepID=UPI003906A49C